MKKSTYLKSHSSKETYSLHRGIKMFLAVLLITTQLAASPYISNFNPTSASTGQTISIFGRQFNGATSVSFGNTAAASFTIVNDSLIQAVVGTGASGRVTIFTPTGSDSLTGFTYVAQAASPTITNFSPQSGTFATTVTITGTNFTGATAVAFGGVAARSFTVHSPTSITASVSTGATGGVTVSTPQGTVTINGFTYNSRPRISSFSPTSAGAGQTVNIFGTKFTGATAVTFGDSAAASFTVVYDSIIQAVVGTGASGKVKVTTAIGLDTLAGFTFAAQQAAPTITSFSPQSGSYATTVTITGTNFTGATAVKFGGVAALSFTVTSPTSITASVYHGTGAVSVTTPQGTASVNGFTYGNPPIIDRISPTSAGTGQTVNIIGFGFNGATSVRFGGVAAASYTIVTDSLIQAVVDTGASGEVRVITPCGYDSLRSFIFVAKPTVTPSGANPVTGAVNQKETVDATVTTHNGTAYVQRHYDIEPVNNPATSTATITLHFSQEDFNNFNAYPNHGPDLPTGPNDNIGKANIRIYQYHGFSTTSIPASYSGSGVEINPDDNRIVWNAAKQLWEVSFDVSGFSGFFLSSSNLIASILSLDLVSLSSTVQGNNVLLRWLTSKDIKANQFELQKSIDGVDFKTVSVTDAGININRYEYSDKLTRGSTAYYRLLIPDGNGTYTFSNTIKVNILLTQNLVVYPNPASDYVAINHPKTPAGSIEVIDMSGRIMKKIKQEANVSQTRMNIKNLPRGSYKVIWSNGRMKQMQVLLVQ